jgi:glyoxylase-like metal-dependent hydrolase (beta-lactamase superfamily II)
MHFDHAGGLLSSFQEEKDAELCFSSAQFVVGQVAWERAQSPHFRDRASFIPALSPLLEESGRLVIVPQGASSHEVLGDRIYLRQSDGHTPGMLIPTLQGTTSQATFCADLVPGSPWVHLPITMGYDRFPERLIDEKHALYEALGTGTWLLFTHDHEVAAGRLARGERGKYAVEEPKEAIQDWDLDAS